MGRFPGCLDPYPFPEKDKSAPFLFFMKLLDEILESRSVYNDRLETNEIMEIPMLFLAFLNLKSIITSLVFLAISHSNFWLHAC